MIGFSLDYGPGVILVSLDFSYFTTEAVKNLTLLSSLKYYNPIIFFLRTRFSIMTWTNIGEKNRKSLSKPILLRIMFVFFSCRLDVYKAFL